MGFLDEELDEIFELVSISALHLTWAKNCPQLALDSHLRQHEAMNRLKTIIYEACTPSTASHYSLDEFLKLQDTFEYNSAYREFRSLGI